MSPNVPTSCPTWALTFKNLGMNSKYLPLGSNLSKILVSIDSNCISAKCLNAAGWSTPLRFQDPHGHCHTYVWAHVQFLYAERCPFWAKTWKDTRRCSSTPRSNEVEKRPFILARGSEKRSVVCVQLFNVQQVVSILNSPVCAKMIICASIKWSFICTLRLCSHMHNILEIFCCQASLQIG